jgi:predicted nucleotidyltransferase
MNKLKSFKTLSEIDDYVNKTTRELHQNCDNFIFLGGSFARNSETQLSDIDYSVCVDEKIEHPRFYFELISLNGTPRLLSNYYFQYDEILINNSQVDDEIYLWMKLFLPETRFVGGNEANYEKVK